MNRTIYTAFYQSMALTWNAKFYGFFLTKDQSMIFVDILFVCVGPGYCIQCGSSNPLGFIGFSLKPKVLGVCNAPSTNGSYGYIGIGGGNLLTLPTPVVKPNTTPAVI